VVPNVLRPLLSIVTTIAVLSGFDDLRALIREFPDALISSVADLGMIIGGS